MKACAFWKSGAVTALTLWLSVPAQGQPASAGSALHLFNGPNSYAAVSGYQPPTNEITIEFWQRAGRVQPQSTLSIFPDDPNNRINVHVPYADGVVYWDFGNSSGAGRLAYTPPVPIAVTWQHFAFEASQSGNYMAIYRNGVLEAYKTGMTPFIFVPGTYTLVLGALLVNSGFYFCGDLDEVRIWNVARSQSAIQSTLHRPLVGNEAGLVAYWRFDEGSGTTTADATGNGNNASLVNNAAWCPSSAPLSYTPVLVLNPPSPYTNECHAGYFYTDPGATVTGRPMAIAAGSAFSLALKADGTVLGWGDDSSGALEVPASGTNMIAITCGGGSSLGLRTDGTVVGWGNGPQTNIPASAVNVVRIAAGYFNGLALKGDGTVVAWGSGTNNSGIGFNYGQSMVPPGLNQVVAIAAGQFFSMALKADGTVVAWGAGTNAVGTNPNYGQTVVPPGLNQVVAIAAGVDHSLALKADGTVVAWGRNNGSQTNVAARATNVVAISAGLDFSMALKADGTVVGWGTNNSGQVVSGATQSATNVISIAAGSSHCLALRADGTVVGWGDNTFDEVNDGNPLSLAQSLAQYNFYYGGTVDIGTPGTYDYNYITKTNVFGDWVSATRTVVVVDTTPPSVTLVGPNPLSQVVGTPFADPGATATDVCAGDLTGGIVVLGTVNTNRAGSYNLTYAAMDPSGNIGTTNRVVWVTPNQPQPTSTISFSDAANPNGTDTTVYFRYGPTTSYGSSTTPQDIGPGPGLVSFSASFSNLLPNTTYHYSLVTSNSNGITYGPDMSFTTSPYLVPGDLNGDGIVDSSEVNIMLSNYWPHSPWLLMTNVAGLSTSNVQFALPNTNNWDLSVLVSTNLVDWSFLGPASPLYQFFDPAATNLPRRFYRLRWP